MANVSFYRCSRTSYNSLTKVDGGLYFITDENVFILWNNGTEQEYSGKVKVVPSFPEPDAAIAGWLYISGTTGKISNGTSWTKVFPGDTPVNTLVTSNETDAVTGKAVATYVTTTLGLDTATENGGSGYAHKIPKLNEYGVLNTSLLPSIVISDFRGTVTSESALNALSAENGDWAILNLSSDPDHKNGTYIYFDDDNSSNTDTPRWIPMGSLTTEAIQALIGKRLPFPLVSGSTSNGTSGQVLSSNGDGTTSWTTIQALTWNEP